MVASLLALGMASVMQDSGCTSAVLNSSRRAAAALVLDNSGYLSHSNFWLLHKLLWPNFLVPRALFTDMKGG